MNNHTTHQGFTVGYDIENIGSRIRVLAGVASSLAIFTTDVIGNWPPLPDQADKEIHG